MLQTLAIRFATVDNAEAFKAAFLEARQYVLENQVGLAHKSQPSSLDLTICTQARRIQEEEELFTSSIVQVGSSHFLINSHIARKS